MKDLSRVDWTTEQESWPGYDRINMGSLQRIADAEQNFNESLAEDVTAVGPSPTSENVILDK